MSWAFKTILLTKWNRKLVKIASSNKPDIQPMSELTNKAKRDLSSLNNAEEFQLEKKISEESIKS